MYENQDLELMNIINGINIVGFIQFNNMGMSRFILQNSQYLVIADMLFTSVFDRYFHISLFHNIIENTQMQNKSFSMFHEIGAPQSMFNSIKNTDKFNNVLVYIIICSFHVNISSIMIPKYLYEVTRLRTVAPILSSKSSESDT